MEGATSPPWKQGSTGNSYFNPLLMSMLGIVVTAIAIIMYHCLLVKYCLGRRASTTTAAQPSKRPAGLDEEVLKTIPIVAFSAVKHDMDQLDIECAVCLGELEDEDMVRLIPNCDHAFHAACIDQWFASHDTCPLCRSPIHNQTDQHPTDDSDRRVTVESITSATDEQASPRGGVSPVVLPPQETYSQLKRSVSVNGEMRSKFKRLGETCSEYKRSGSVDRSSVVINLEMDSFLSDSSSSCGVQSGSGSCSEPSVANFDRVSSAKWLCRSLSRLQMGKGTNTAILPI